MENQERLFVGKDYWHVNGVDGLSEIMLSDGPHGLRKQEGEADFLGQHMSKPAVCYPSASALGCSFDRKLTGEIGAALGQECRQEKVSVLLGPGVNHKRSPLCGRNFEYYSEDPVLTGELAASYINGLQEQGVGASLKHFAANSREKGRMIQDSVIDRRALMELYLRQFEIVVRKSKPWTIMNSYNKLNGIHCTENAWLMKEIARKRWGFDGIFLSDWGATYDAVASIKNGMNLEMPGGDRGSVKQIQRAHKKGIVTDAELEENTEYIKKLLQRSSHIENSSFDLKAHLQLAQRAAEESAVLLKNESILPVPKDKKIALIGAFAKNSRFQGEGSSKINPIALDNIYEAFTQMGISFCYAAGYNLTKDEVDKELIAEACENAKSADVVIVIAGLPDAYESEGFDRTHIRMPESHNQLIESLAAIHSNVVVVLQGGSVMAMPWFDQVQAVLHMHLSGCQGGKAAAHLLFGEVNPSGKLAESYPFSIEDNPSFESFDDNLYVVNYRESIYSGYRYYDTFHKPVRFPFGYGLSYTTFDYSNLTVSEPDGRNVTVRLTVENTGAYAGAEVVQLYVGMKDSKIARPAKELKDFQKVWLEAGEKKEVVFELKEDAFYYYNTAIDDWDVEDGMYQIMTGASSADIRQQVEVQIVGNLNPYSALGKDYMQWNDNVVKIPDAAFEKILGRAVPKPREPKPFTVDSTVTELNTSKLGRMILKKITNGIEPGQNPMLDAMMRESPIRGAVMINDAIRKNQIEGLIDILNGKIIRGIWKVREK